MVFELLTFKEAKDMFLDNHDIWQFVLTLDPYLDPKISGLCLKVLKTPKTNRIIFGNYISDLDTDEDHLLPYLDTSYFPNDNPVEVVNKEEEIKEDDNPLIEEKIKNSEKIDKLHAIYILGKDIDWVTWYKLVQKQFKEE
jgi:hypothetical protein